MNVWDVVTRIYRRHQNEIAWKREAGYSEEEIERVTDWLAGVSYGEWFALVEECERLRRGLENVCQTGRGPHVAIARAVLDAE